MTRLGLMIGCLALCITVPALSGAQTLVVLKLGAGASALGEAQGGVVALRLASGTIIYVPVGDVDTDASMRLLDSRPTIAAEPQVPRPAPQVIQPPDVPSAPPQASAPPAVVNVYRPVNIERKCANDWPTDFRMRNYCENLQREAQVALGQRPMGFGARVVIRQKCATDWPDDFRMRNYCEEKQLEALGQLGR